MKKIILLIVAFVLFGMGLNKAAAQSIEFTKINFPDNSKELKAVLKSIDEGDKLFKQGEWLLREALPFYQQAQEFNPNNAELNYKIGRCLYASKQKQEALAHFQRAQQLKPNVSGDVQFWIAKVYHDSGEFDKAIQQYNSYKSSMGEVDMQRLSEVNRLIQQCETGIVLMKKPVRVFIDNVGSKVNSKYAEYSPIVNADESVMFFTSSRPNDANAKLSEDGSYPENIYYSVRANGEWGEPVNPGTPVNTDGHSANAGLSPDGQTLFIYYAVNGGDIYECQAVGDQWTKPVALNSNINTKYHESSASLAPDGKHLYFVSDRQGGVGLRDIYVSEKDAKGKWGTAQLLPTTINTPYDEEAVFSHPDGRTLYFSSKGHNSMGGFDIFKSTFENGQWSAPQNLGYPINTPEDDVFFSLSASGRHGYYSSDRKGGLGDHDIYMITFLGNEKPMINSAEDNLLAWRTKPIAETVIESTLPINTISMTLLKGRVLDQISSQPVAAKIILTDLDKNVELATFASNAATGKYLVSLPSGKNYGITVMSDKYLFHSENFNIPEVAMYQEAEKDIYLNKIAVGSKVVLNNIFFDSGKATLRPESKNELERMVTLLKEYPSLSIEISGHTDNVGSATSNKSLSERRAKAVVDHLIQAGVNASRLTYVGYGFEQPVAPNDTEANRQLNRRTEFKILKN